MNIREASAEDFAAIWPIFRDIVRAGDTYGFDPDCSEAEARRLWMELPRATFVAEDEHDILGTYYIKTNMAGPGEHVCNCGYMVSNKARGRGFRAQLQFAGITGTKYIELEYMEGEASKQTPSLDFEPKEPFIPSYVAPSMS